MLAAEYGHVNLQPPAARSYATAIPYGGAKLPAAPGIIIFFVPGAV